MDDRPEPTPEGALISRAARRKGLSARQAAPTAGISEARWRQIVNGYQSVGGQQIRVVAPAATLAAMAAAVGVSPERLEETGRADAAKVLREDIADGRHTELADGNRYRDSVTGEEYEDLIERQLWDMVELTEQDRRELILYLRARRAAQSVESRREYPRKGIA